MPYPTIEQYQTNLQNPRYAFADAELSSGSIERSGLGTPLARCGGFALTYAVTSARSRKFAVRCFKRESGHLEDRYRAIAIKITHLKTLRSPYFIDVEYQPEGVRVDGGRYPVVKMAWASGTTLGEFVEARHQDARALRNLRESLRKLCDFLEKARIAHGDIQSGNVMVENEGADVRLIDYDGMYVDAIAKLESSELGHVNFQHPQRATVKPFDTTLDRFAFISIDVALRALEADPSVWRRSNSDGDCLVFRANDFADPWSSKLLKDLRGSKNSELREAAERLSQVCAGDYAHIPRLQDFLKPKACPSVPVLPHHVIQRKKKYIAAFPVLDASIYESCLPYVGDRVELVGRVESVYHGITSRDKPFCFVNLGDRRKNGAKLNIWSEGLRVLREAPSDSWKGSWLSVIGLLDSPYTSERYGNSQVSITVCQSDQISRIGHEEAMYRLGRGTGESGTSSEREVPSRVPPATPDHNGGGEARLRQEPRPDASLRFQIRITKPSLDPVGALTGIHPLALSGLEPAVWGNRKIVGVAASFF